MNLEQVIRDADRLVYRARNAGSIGEADAAMHELFDLLDHEFGASVP